jgi:hypothetical protein
MRNQSRMLVVFLCGASIILAACTLGGNAITIVGSENVVTREEDLGGFDKLSASHSFQLQVSQGEAYRVVVRADDNIMDYIVVKKNGNTLEIGLDPKHNYGLHNVTLEAEVTMPALTEIGLSGSSDAIVSGFASTETFNADLSGSSSLRGDLEAGDASFQLSGSSSVVLTGSAGDAEIDASGSSDIDLSAFPVDDANVNASGSTTVTIQPRGRLDVDASGASHVYYLGDPTLGNIDTSGGSSVERR